MPSFAKAIAATRLQCLVRRAAAPRRSGGESAQDVRALQSERERLLDDRQPARPAAQTRPSAPSERAKSSELEIISGCGASSPAAPNSTPVKVDGVLVSDAEATSPLFTIPVNRPSVLATVDDEPPPHEQPPPAGSSPDRGDAPVCGRAQS